jgi:hypothetical protein
MTSAVPVVASDRCRRPGSGGGRPPPGASDGRAAGRAGQRGGLALQVAGAAGDLVGLAQQLALEVGQVTALPT